MINKLKKIIDKNKKITLSESFLDLIERLVKYPDIIKTTIHLKAEIGYLIIENLLWEELYEDSSNPLKIVSKNPYSLEFKLKKTWIKAKPAKKDIINSKDSRLFNDLIVKKKQNNNPKLNNKRPVVLFAKKANEEKAPIPKTNKIFFL